MNSREISLANKNRQNLPRCGLDFDRGRISDLIFTELKPYGYQQKRWKEGKIEYYNDEWGNIWHRMIEGSFHGEIIHPAIKEWSDIKNLRVADYSQPEWAATMTALFKQPVGQFKMAAMGGWVFDSACYLRKMDGYFMEMGLRNASSLPKQFKLFRSWNSSRKDRHLEDAGICHRGLMQS